MLTITKLLVAVFTANSAMAVDANMNPGTVFKDCDTCPDMVVIPPGEIIQGRDGRDAMEPERYEGLPHKVTIAYKFAVGKTEATTGQFREFAKATGYQNDEICNIWDGMVAHKDPGTNWKNPGYGRPAADNEPGACLSWNDGKAYMAWLSKKTAKKYRFLTESEWEHVARAGRPYALYAWGDDPNQACQTANVFDQSAKNLPPPMTPRKFPPANCSDGHPIIAPAGALAPNPFGVYDMIGSIWEWVEDCYVFPYPANTPTDGSAYLGPDGCDRRVSKGGSWTTTIYRQIPTFRGRDPAIMSSQAFGFRIARDLD